MESVNGTLSESEIRNKYHLARTLSDAGKYEDALSIVQTLFDAKYAFQGEEREFIISLWQSQITPFRDAIQGLSQLEKPKDHIPAAIDALKKVMCEKLDKIIEVLSKLLIPYSKDEETEGVYLKTLADFQRYKLECVTRAQVAPLSSDARANYIKAMDIFKSLPRPCLDLQMGCQLNYAILLSDYLNQRKKALDIVTQNHKELSAVLDKVGEGKREVLQNLMELMEDVLNRWNPRQ